MSWGKKMTTLVQYTEVQIATLTLANNFSCSPKLSVLEKKFELNKFPNIHVSLATHSQQFQIDYMLTFTKILKENLTFKIWKFDIFYI